MASSIARMPTSDMSLFPFNKLPHNQSHPNARASSLIQMFGGSEKGCLVRVRSRREMEDLVERMRTEREREVGLLAEMQRVSRFAHRGRIQSILKLRFLRKDLAIQDLARTTPMRAELQRSENRFAILFLRERFDNRNQNDDNKILVMERLRKVDQFPVDSQDSVSSYSTQSSLVYNHGQDLEVEVISIGDPGSSPPESSSPRFRIEDILQEGSDRPELNLLNSGSEYLQKGSPDASWDERNLWVNNIDLQSNIESPNSPSWQSESEVLTEELESWGDSRVNGQEYHDFVETFSNKTEIRELLQRRRVTTSLTSDFCDKMNQMLMKFLRRQGQQIIDDDFAEEYGEGPIWRHNYEFNCVSQVVPDSSLVSSPYQTVRSTTFSHHSYRNRQESKVVPDLKNEMAQMREEINELRKMVESCMEWQAKLQTSIKEEVFSAVHQSVPVLITSKLSKWIPGWKHNCCICNEMQVDSFLYRCGHMCTCFKCAHELQWKSGICPICQAPILDVVRAYPDTR